MRNLTLLTDLYQLTMGYGFYRQNKHEEEVVFDLFFRKNALITYSIAAGLEQAMEYLLHWHFDEEDIVYLRSLNLFDEGFLEYLRNMRFTGDVYAVKEGTPVFPSEPILTVKAPLIQAQFAETALLNIINHPALQGLPMVLETPNELPGYAREIAEKEQELAGLQGENKACGDAVARLNQERMELEGQRTRASR